MHEARIRILNDADADGDGRYVLYWMQQAQRVAFNHALEYAVRIARDRDQGVVVCFGLTDDYPDANARHYAFMLGGLAEVDAALAERGIKFVMLRGEPDTVALRLAQEASVVVCDRGYLRDQRRWRRRVAREAGKQVVQVETDIAVPVESASDKREYAARTIRKKITGQLDEFLQRLTPTEPAKSTRRLSLGASLGDRVDAAHPQAVLSALDVDTAVSPVQRFEPGRAAAGKQLENFLRQRLNGYAEARNDPADPAGSRLSPYLHFGQISALEIALKVRAAGGASKQDTEALLEELIVRRELAANFVYYTDDYDSYRCLPDWARSTLEAHRDDSREHIYTRAELEAGDTHDEYFNAAMVEMRRTGYMHNYMRMYWGKKILEWTNTPEYGYSTALYLNNKYFLDGRDPNSYANVGWLFGLHDRPWSERPVFGKVRYMNAAGLERKFDIGRYVEWTATL